MCSCDVSVHPPFYEDDNNQGLRSKGFVPKQHASVVRDKNDDTPVDCETTWGEWSGCSETCGGVNDRYVLFPLYQKYSVFRVVHIELELETSNFGYLQ